MSDVSPLRLALDVARAERGLSMKDLTVLSAQRDPFRLDTPARHRDGQWLADAITDLGLTGRRIHLRGLHYAVLGRTKPDGSPYTNTDDEWTWISETAGKAARWLGYVPFEQIVDQRNDEPVIRVFDQPEPDAWLTVGVRVDIPDAADLMPEAVIEGFAGVQPYKLAIFGEKSSLTEVLAPLAEAYRADLYLPTGEISDTLLHRMATVGAADGRPMVVLCFSDSDPGGWQMPISIARKLQAFRVLLCPELDFEVHRVALTPDQVREYGLPYTPLKETERRGDSWRELMGVEQTEIDALASLRPDLLREIARDALDQFFDHTLDSRVFAAESQWYRDAAWTLENSTDQAALGQLRTLAAERLTEMQDEIRQLNAQMRVAADGFELPPIPEAPPAAVPIRRSAPLIDSRWSFAEQCHALIESKAYRVSTIGPEPGLFPLTA
jgi:hypothetical protein